MRRHIVRVLGVGLVVGVVGCGATTKLEELCVRSNRDREVTVTGFVKIEKAVVWLDESGFPVTLVESKYGVHGINAYVRVGEGPNTLSPLPEFWSDRDVKLTLDDGTTRGHRERVAFTGTLSVRDDGLCRLEDITKLSAPRD
jgi:hypothetical protein